MELFWAENKNSKDTPKKTNLILYYKMIEFLFFMVGMTTENFITKTISYNEFVVLSVSDRCVFILNVGRFIEIGFDLMKLMLKLGETI